MCIYEPQEKERSRLFIKIYIYIYYIIKMSSKGQKNNGEGKLKRGPGFT